MIGRHYQLQLEILSPVHIGTGETLTRLDYIIDTKNGADDEEEPIICLFNKNRIFQHCTTQELDEFYRMVSQAGGNYTTLQKWFEAHARSLGNSAWKDIIPTDNYVKDTEYKDNAGELALLPRTLTGRFHRPYIPGSAVKGAIRTALSRALMPPNQASITWKELNKRIWGPPTQDPMQHLKIGDFVVPQNKEWPPYYFVGTARELKDPQKGQSAPKGFVESLLFAEFDGDLADTLKLPAKGNLKPFRMPYAKHRTVDLPFLIQACNTHFKHVMDLEEEHYFKGRLKHVEGVNEIIDFLEEIRRYLDNMPQNACLLRIGRFSHREAMTLWPDPEGSTRTCFLLDDFLYPFGWVLLHFIKPNRQPPRKKH